MKRLTILAGASLCTSYGIHALQLAKDLERLAGAYVSIRPLSVWEPWGQKLPADVRQRFVQGPQPEDWEILVNPPTFLPTPGKRTVYVTMCESTRLPTTSVEMLNRAEVVVVPSQFCATVFSASGVTKPIRIVPLGINPDVFRYRPPVNDGIIRFGTAGRTNSNRKGVNDVIEAFKLAFNAGQQNVRLSVKTYPDCKLADSDPRIEFHNEFWPETKLADWYAGLSYFVSATRGEGWGLMQQQVIAVGRPLIAPWWSGLTEFFQPEYGFPIPYRLEQASTCGHWAGLDINSIAGVMFLTASFNEGKKLCAEESKHASFKARDFTWQASAEAMIDVFKEFGVSDAVTEKLVQSNPKKVTDLDALVTFYREQPTIKRLPLRSRPVCLTNTVLGLGDTMMLTDLPRAAAKAGKNFTCISASEHFKPLMSLNPHYRAPSLLEQTEMLNASSIVHLHDTGNGHYLQRLRRAYGLPVDDKPAGFLQCNQSKSELVVMHFEPGHHAAWQRKNVHKRARELYPKSKEALERFIKERKDCTFVQIGGRQVTGAEQIAVEKPSLVDLIATIARAKWFIGIMSGPLHIATALGVRCIVMVNFPEAERIFLPTLKPLDQVEEAWFYPQNVHLHQEGEGRQVKRFTTKNLHRAFDGELYPFWSDKYLSLIHETV